MPARGRGTDDYRNHIAEHWVGRLPFHPDVLDRIIRRAAGESPAQVTRVMESLTNDQFANPKTNTPISEAL